MWRFEDKAKRPVTLIPEATAVVQQLYRENWRSKKKPIKVFYDAQCFRYERPQLGRYRQFRQFGLEILGPADYEAEAKRLLLACLDSTGAPYGFSDDVARGLSYYTRQGFEASCPLLGAQSQIAGGGSYSDGCGWAIGIDRLVIALMLSKAAP